MKWEQFNQISFFAITTLPYLHSGKLELSRIFKTMGFALRVGLPFWIWLSLSCVPWFLGTVYPGNEGTQYKIYQIRLFSSVRISDLTKNFEFLSKLLISYVFVYVISANLRHFQLKIVACSLLFVDI